MKTTTITVEFQCEMCDKTAITKRWGEMPSGWKAIADKHYCAHCKRLVGKRPRKLTTLEVRRCLVKMQGYGGKIRFHNRGKEG